jgi:hypothetical protein
MSVISPAVSLGPQSSTTAQWSTLHRTPKHAQHDHEVAVNALTVHVQGYVSKAFAKKDTELQVCLPPSAVHAAKLVIPF